MEIRFRTIVSDVALFRVSVVIETMKHVVNRNYEMTLSLRESVEGRAERVFLLVDNRIPSGLPFLLA